jgi:hypothetical protein
MTSVMDHLHLQHLLAKLLVTLDTRQFATVLALATLGDATQIDQFLLAKLNVADVIVHNIALNFANVNLA